MAPQETDLRKAQVLTIDGRMEELAKVLDQAQDDVVGCKDELIRWMTSTLELPHLESFGTASRSAADDSAVETDALYADDNLRLVRARWPAGYVQRPHNHGTWNLMGVYQGTLHYRSYKRLDDGKQPYYAELVLDEDRLMEAGDVTVLPPPPHDIHAVAALAPDTVTLLVAREFAPVREEYLIDLRAYYHIGPEGVIR